MARSLISAVLLCCVLVVLQPDETLADVTWTRYGSGQGYIDPPNDSGTEQTCALVLDIDRDGIDDMVVVERTMTPSVVWYKLNSNGNGWDKYVIDNIRRTIEAGGDFFDIDGDGDLDVVFGDDNAGNTVYWYENPYPNFNPQATWTRRMIKTSGGYKHHDQTFGDVDGDGAVEFITWNQRSTSPGVREPKLLVYTIPANPKTHVGDWPLEAMIMCPVTDFEWEGIDIADIDLDGKNEIVGAGHWWKHTGGSNYERFVIDNGRKREFTRTQVGQLVPGGRPEVVICPGDANGPLNWYGWTGSTWQAHTINSYVNNGHSLQLADFNGDGKLDVFCAEMGDPGAGAACQLFIYYGDGSGNFTEQLVATGIANHESKVGDLDGDGDIDIISKPYRYNAPRLDVWLNNSDVAPPPPPPPPPPTGDWTYISIDSNRSVWGDFDDPSWLGYFGLGWTDVNGDGKLDIVSGRYVYRNPGGNMDAAWQRVDLGMNVDASLGVNVDGDNRADVIGCRGSDVYWFESANADGTNWTSILIDDTAPTTGHVNPQGYVVADVIAGGRKEVILSNNKKIFYYTIPSTIPHAGNWPRTEILSSSNSEGFGVGDIDRDGRLDIAAAHTITGSNQIQWAKNPGNGSGGWTTYIIGQAGTNRLDRVAVGDINNDGRLDILCTEEVDSGSGASTFWFEAPVNPTQGNWTRRTIVTQYSTNSLDVADIDGDGDADVILQEHLGAKKLSIWTNNGSGALSETVVDTGKAGHLGGRIVDLDVDGDFDIVSISFDGNVDLWRNDNDGSVQPPPPTHYCIADNDQDGFGNAAGTTIQSADNDCNDPGEATSTDDCNDSNALIHPGATEIPDDGIDQDCNGSDLVTPPPTYCIADNDGDGYGNAAGTTIQSADGDCNDPGEANTASDCNDSDASIHPNANDTPGDGIDQDCDGSDAAGTAPTYCIADGDGDGYGNSAGTTIQSADDDCDDAGEATSSNDCDDHNPAIHPGATEIPDDGIDQDCSGSDATSGGGGGGGGGVPVTPPAAPDRFLVSGTIASDGTFVGELIDADGRVLGGVTITGGPIGVKVTIKLVDDNRMPGPDGLSTIDGFDGGKSMTRTLVVEVDADSPGVVTLLLYFSEDELLAAGFDPDSLQMHALDESSDPPTWVPAGENISPPQQVPSLIGQTGFYIDDETGTVVYWVVRDVASAFAVGMTRPANDGGTVDPDPDDTDPDQNPDDGGESDDTPATGDPDDQPATDGDGEDTVTPPAGLLNCAPVGGAAMAFMAVGLLALQRRRFMPRSS